MSKFYLQSGYEGKETSCIALNYDKSEFNYSARNQYAGEIPVGSVEFVEELLGRNFIPDYYPFFLKNHLHRKVWYSEDKLDRSCFVKPADRHKRFEAQISDDRKRPIGYGGGVATGIWVGPYWHSEVVSFKEEWRHYVANGKVLAAYWYLGEEKEIDSPELNIDWPQDFCGAVDFGRLTSGELALVENNLPYACGWYGPYSEGKIYGEWLKAGLDFLNKIK
jgi:hypothetical protein